MQCLIWLFSVVPELHGFLVLLLFLLLLHVMCLIATWLDSSFNCHFSPDIYLVYRAHSVTAEKNRWTENLCGRLTSVPGATRTTDQELAEECVWHEIPPSDGFNLIYI